MFVYAFDPVTKEYRGPIEVQESPLEPGKYLDDIPNTLKFRAPLTGPHEVGVAEGNEWVVKPDYRGDWFGPDGALYSITEIGVEPAAGWTREPPVLPDQPIAVTPWQFRKALNQQGLRADVENAVAASDDQDLKDGWEFATEFVRNDPFVVSMAVAIGKTDADLDALFELAKTL